MKGRFSLLAGAVLVFFLSCGALLLTGINCPVRWLTGIPCPGCGMTRACLALLVGDWFWVRAPYAVSPFGTGLLQHIRAAWYFHPLVFVIPPALLYILLAKKPLFGSKNRERAFVLGGCLLMIGVYLVRLALHDPVLQADWNAGMIARTLSAVFRR